MLPIPPRRRKKPAYYSKSFVISEAKVAPTQSERKLVRILQLHESENGRLVQKRTIKEGSYQRRQKENSWNTSFQPDSEAYCASMEVDSDEEGDAETEVKLDEEIKVQRLRELEAFLQNRQEYLDELLRRDGRGENSALECCSSERRGLDGVYRCLDCRRMHVVCKQCILHKHQYSPLHRIESWKGFWEKESLEEAGLVVQLGHPQGCECDKPDKPIKPLIIVHVNGIHRVRHLFCNCGKELPKRIQLIREGWFPATQSRPATAFTFEVLDLFLAISYRGKANARDFVSALENLTNGLGIDVPDRYEEFLRVSRQYSHLLLLKRGGRGHDEHGINSTKQGELAIACPACPQPEKNMLHGWENASEDEKWIYGMSLAIDANFRLKLKDRRVADPEFGPGWAYFVNEENYQAEIKNHSQPKEKSDCTSTHQAIERATSKMNEGYSVTGIGAVICSRHGFIRPNGVGDLQYGERYANMDYIFLASILGTSVKTLNISYDIACQWSRNLSKRVANFPSDMQSSFHKASIQFFVPKFHLPAHGDKCQGPYSLNFRPGVGRTDGEGIERGWSIVNPLATMLREMGPGFRHDTFNNHWSALNWGKLTGLGKILRSNLDKAVRFSVKHSAKHRALTAAREASTVADWNARIEQWLISPFDFPNPFFDPPATQSIVDVRRQLAEEEEEMIWTEDDTQSLVNKTPSEFIYEGIELEQQIINFNALEKPRDVKDKKSSSWCDKQAALQRKALAWVELQKKYAPLIASVALSLELSKSLAKSSSRLTLEDSTINIILPSNLQSMDRNQLYGSEVACGNLFVSSEKALRFAQLDDSIESIKRLLKTKSSSKDFTRQNVRGQKGNTRAQTTLKRWDKKVKQQAERYRRAYSALLTLDPGGEWKTVYKILDNSDCHLTVRRRGAHEDSDEDDDDDDDDLASKETESAHATKNRHPSSKSSKRKRKGEGHRTSSWIWDIKRNSLDDHEKEADDDILRVIWTRSKARCERWIEEVVIVLEEMRRTLAYCEWKANWWRSRQTGRTGSSDLMEGLSAYALKQANAWTMLGESFASQWAPLIRRYNLPSDWPASYRKLLLASTNCELATDRKWVLRVKEALRFASVSSQSCSGLSRITEEQKLDLANSSSESSDSDS